MAVIKAVNSKSSLKNVIQYVTDKEKTEEKLISGKDCNSSSAFEEMQTTKEQFDKLDGRQYKHFIQSFDPHDNLDYQKAHKVGLEWAEKNFKGYEVLIATHQDKDHIHNHFVVNSVSFENGEKYRQSKKDLEKMKELSDKICEREGLHVITHKSPGKELSMNEYQVAIKGESWKFKLINEIDKSMAQSKTKEDFIKSMEDKGYKVNWTDTRKYITYITPEGNKARDNKLHDEKYTKEAMENGFRSIKESELSRGNAGADRAKGDRKGFGLSWDKSEVGASIGRANQLEQQGVKTPGPKREGQEGAREEVSGQQRRQEQHGITAESADKGNETGNRGLEKRQLSEVRADSKEGVGGINKEPGQQQRTDKASNGVSVSSKEYTKSIIHRKGEAVLDPASSNSRINRGTNGIVPGGNVLAEAFKALGNSIEKAEQKERAAAEREKARLERKMQQKSKDNDLEYDFYDI
jgi:hypothetical protein